MLHQAEIEGQVRRLHAHFVEREDKGAFLRLQIIIGIGDAFGDALEHMRLAQIVSGEEDFQLFEGDIGIDGHASRTHERARKLELDILAGHAGFLEGESETRVKGRDHFFDQNFRCGRARRQSHGLGTL